MTRKRGPRGGDGTGGAIHRACRPRSAGPALRACGFGGRNDAAGPAMGNIDLKKFFLKQNKDAPSPKQSVDFV
jgi:hypothetical protein